MQCQYTYPLLPLAQSQCTFAEIKQHKERLQSPAKQLPCSVLPSAGGSLGTESSTKRAGETPCQKQCKDTAGENCHNMHLQQNNPLSCGEKLALC